MSTDEKSRDGTKEREALIKKLERLAANAGALYSTADLALLFGVSTKTIHRWIAKGELPEADVRRSRKTIRWRPTTIQPYLEGRR